VSMTREEEAGHAAGKRTRGVHGEDARCMVATFTDRCRPLRNFTERVAGAAVGRLGRRFGPFPS
jgi:hypothetical protein